MNNKREYILPLIIGIKLSDSGERDHWKMIKMSVTVWSNDLLAWPINSRVLLTSGICGIVLEILCYREFRCLISVSTRIKRQQDVPQKEEMELLRTTQTSDFSSIIRLNAMRCAYMYSVFHDASYQYPQSDYFRCGSY